MKTRAFLLLAAIGYAGCERGCVDRWRGDRGVGGAPSRPPDRDRDLAEALFGTDCPSGMLRCVDGRVEASRAARLPHPCRQADGVGRRGACACPWEPVVRCPAGCAVPDLEIAASLDGGADQLCRPLLPNARALGPGDPIPTDICADEEFTCEDGVVRSCDGPGLPVRPVARCLVGCQPGVRMDHGGTTDLDGVVSILCRRDHAERR